MKLKSKIHSALALAKVKFLGKRIPLAVRWQLTNRCPNRCLYCNIWNEPAEELTTEEIFFILDELKELGTQRISFSGGEPMLRKDIGEILNYAREKGISTGMNSCGILIPEKIKEIKSLDLLKISLDGPEEVHDKLCGRPGGYKQAITAIKIAQDNGIKVTLATTLTKYNLQSVNFLVETAQRFHTMVAFQPLKDIYRGIKDYKSLYPELEEWKRTVERLIELKKESPESMRNSLVGLKHIYHWPRYKRLKCWAGRIFCIIETNGDLYPCDRIDYPTPELPNVKELGFKKAFTNLPTVHCSGCGFCGALELNFLLSFKWSTIPVLWRVTGK
ncbi:MAG: radical SAM protein [Candidatus Omnitrophica bacterium]|nr:radical SAM protein [Candidatus Omnitrophota bacterium]